ncbi:MAG: MFS transporter [Cyclobacteriaceae bacterium]
MTSSSIHLQSSEGRWVLVATILASSMAFIDSTALNVILPSLQKQLQADATDLFWVLNAYLLMLASFILLAGALGDKLGRKKVFMFGIALFILASAACGLSNSLNWLIGFRSLQGLGGALMIPGSLSLLSASFMKEEKGKAIGIWSAATTIVTVGGPVLGGTLASAGLWRMIFFINVPLGLAALLALYLKVPESKDDSKQHRIDYEGALAIVGALALLTFGFLRAPEAGWWHWQSSLSLLLGIAALVSFVLIEKKKHHPMVRLGLFKKQDFSGANLLTFLLYAGLGAGMLFLTLNLIQIQGYSQLQAGLSLLPFTLLMAVIGPWAGGMVVKVGPRLFLSGGPAVAGLGFWLLSGVGLTDGPSSFWTSFFPGIVVFGLGMSFTVAPLTTTVMASVSEQQAGTASGVNNSMNRMASVIANAVFGALAIQLFENTLFAEISTLDISGQAADALRQQAVDLGNAVVPEQVRQENKEQVKAGIDNAFVSTYAVLLKICAGLAWLSAICGFFLISGGESNGREKA